MFEKVSGFSKKMKIAKDLIVHGSKLIPVIKAKAEELFDYKKTVSVNDGKVKLTLNGKLECVGLKLDPEYLKTNPSHAIKCIEAAISASNQGMLEHIIEECKKLGNDVDPSLMDKISSEIEGEIEAEIKK